MKMPCRITDEQVYNPWDEEAEHVIEMKGLNDVTLSDLMGEDSYVWVSRNKGYGYVMELESDDCIEPYLREVGINPCAMESLASFCRRFLSFYDKVSGE